MFTLYCIRRHRYVIDFQTCNTTRTITMQKFYIALVLLMITGCSTTGHFKVPEVPVCTSMKDHSRLTSRLMAKWQPNPSSGQWQESRQRGAFPTDCKKVEKPLKKVNCAQNSVRYQSSGHPSQLFTGPWDLTLILPTTWLTTSRNSWLIITTQASRQRHYMIGRP